MKSKAMSLFLKKYIEESNVQELKLIHKRNKKTEQQTMACLSKTCKTMTHEQGIRGCPLECQTNGLTRCSLFLL